MKLREGTRPVFPELLDDAPFATKPPHLDVSQRRVHRYTVSLMLGYPELDRQVAQG